MRQGFWAAAAVTLCLAAPCRAQVSVAKVDSEDSDFGFEMKDKFIFGNQEYRSNDAAISVDLPRGFGLNVDYNFFQSDLSSFTQNFSMGADASWDQAYFAVTYSWSPLQNDSENHALDLKASVHTDSKDFRTTVGADVNDMDNYQYIRAIPPLKPDTLEITQRAGTISLKQQLWDTRVSVDLSGYNYNNDILTYSHAYAERLQRMELLANAAHPRYLNAFNFLSGSINGANGLLAGFPDWSVKFGLSQRVEALPKPLTLWGNYQNTRFLPAYQFFPGAATPVQLVSGIIADSFTLGVDVDLLKRLTASAQYNHVRETSQTVQDLYGVSLALNF